MSVHSLDSLEAAADLIHSVMPATPHFRWLLLSACTGADVWVKHKNHTPIAGVNPFLNHFLYKEMQHWSFTAFRAGSTPINRFSSALGAGRCSSDNAKPRTKAKELAR